MKLKELKNTHTLLLGLLILMAIGLFYVLTDEPNGRVEYVQGVVSNSYIMVNKQTSGYMYCEIKLGDGMVLREQCFLKTGDSVRVCKQSMKNGGVKYYVSGCFPS